MSNENPKEKQFHRLAFNFMKADTDAEEKLALEKLAEFEKENPELVDEIQSRRWVGYY